MRFGVLGPVEIRSADGRILTLPRRRERCLLAVLLIEADRRVSVDRLCELLWADDDPPRRPDRVIQSHVSRIRAVLAEATADVELVSSHGGYLLRVDPDTVDLHRFRRLYDEAGRATDQHLRDRLLREALALWRGPALAGAASGRLRQRLCADLDEQYLQAVEQALATGLDLGRHHDLLPELARLTTEHPTRQRLVELYMTALYRDGRSNDASRTYHDLRDRLATELGVDPDPRLQRLHQEILRGVPGPVAPLRPALLPADLATFAGRSGHLDELDALVSGRTSAIVISAIAGTAGVGKTALAVHWAHRIRHRYPDGQLYINLRGFDPTGAVMTAGEAVRRFLDALQVPPSRIPTSLDAQLDRYRSLLADKRMLIVLDNARDTAQVRPLLPGTPGCLALVTSRNQLTGLVATDGAHPVTLDLLPAGEARDLLARRLGTERVAAEPVAVDRIVSACARLPLALSIVAARAATQPHRALADVAGGLSASLDSLTSDDPHADVRAVFSWSYRALRPAAARLFRLLGLHPGPDISAPAAASLAARTADEVRPLLAELTRANLLIAQPPGRYTLHDLLRAYAADRAGAAETDEERRAAVHRVLDHYLHTAYEANRLLHPSRDPVSLDAPRPGVAPERPADHQQALAWFEAEHAVLLSLVGPAAGTGFDAHVWHLAWTMVNFLDWRGHWRDYVTVFRAAVAAAEGSADASTTARMHRHLGRAYNNLADFTAARSHLEQALELHDRAGDLAGQAHTQGTIGQLCERQGRYAEALDHVRSALDLFRAAGHRTGEGLALNAIGWYHAQLGDLAEALAACEHALTVYQEVGDSVGLASTLHSLGYVHHHLGQHTAATDCYRQAVELYQHLGNRYYEAETLTHLGDTHRAEGDAEAAHAAWRRALAIFTDLGHPDADEVRTRLRNNHV